MERPVVLAVLFAVLLVCEPDVAAQSSPLAWDFDAPPGLQGWAVTGLWAADNTPATGVNGPVPPPAPPSPIGPPPGTSSNVAYSPPNSLNYNDGVDYDTGFPNSGTAISPPITLTAADNFGWRCAYETENTVDGPTAPGVTEESMTNFDRRIVRVRNAAGTVVLELQMIPMGGINPPTWVPGPLTGVQTCGQMGEWHTHYFLLDPAWSPMTVEFSFDTIDAFANTHTGWFVDDVAVGSGGPGGPGGSGPGGAGRRNANGDESGNDLFGESWCGAGAAGSVLGVVAALGVLAALLVRR